MIEPPATHNLFHVPDPKSFRDAAAAIICLDDGRYLMQHRDDKPGIFYPDHWGLFGGALDPDEEPETALQRELREELGWDMPRPHYFTTMNFGFDVLGIASTIRVFYTLSLSVDVIPRLTLGEGQSMQALTSQDILLEKRVVPYDAFALWLHHAWRIQGSPAPVPPQTWQYQASEPVG
ncbi:MAG: NUDIX domain-containing protein [Pseudomonadota bacterium]